MATLASTLVEGTAVGLPIPIGGVHLEIWRVAGGTVGDTATITPRRGRYVVSGISAQSAQTNLSTSGTDTNVVFTLTASVSTSVTFDVWLLNAE